VAENPVVVEARAHRAARGSGWAVLGSREGPSVHRASEVGDEKWTRLVEHHDVISRHATSDNGGRVVKSTGDGVLATFPTPTSALTATTTMRDQLLGADIPIRAGAHIGQIEVRSDGDIAGIAVNIAARVEAHAQSGEIVVSHTLRDMLMGTDHTFTNTGTHQLKGVDGDWTLYRLDPN